jgi:hypothetical protein
LIPHPLTLLFCWLIGSGLASALGYVLQFIGELCADAARVGAGPGFYGAALFVLGAVSMFASGFFIGAAMRLLAEKPWMKAAGWALLAAVLSHARTPRAILFAAPGCFLGAYLCDRYRREERWLEDTEGFLRSWMFWERGGAL